jgi:hypothetical protein
MQYYYSVIFLMSHIPASSESPIYFVSLSTKLPTELMLVSLSFTNQFYETF